MIEKLVRKDFKIIDKKEGISKIFGYLKKEAHFPIIMDGKKPWGIIDERRLIKSRLLGNEKIKDFVIGVPKIDMSYSIRKAKEIMLKSGVDKLIVTSNKELIGYITAIDVARELGNNKNAELLMRYVEAINEDDCIGDAINMMKRQNEKVLPVLSNNKFSGIIGIRNIISLISTHEKITNYHQEKTSLLDAPVKGFMERGIKTCSPKDGIKDIVEILDEQEFAIVCKNREYLGIIEPIDLLR